MNIDLTDDTIGQLTVIRKAGRDGQGKVMWWCRCSCGTEKAIRQVVLRSGATKSCGCLVSILAKIRETKHGHAYSEEYHVWQAMRQRCQNPNHKCYPSYGGRGIFVCPEWDDFSLFYEDMGPKPSKNHSMDRKNNDGPYNKTNCQWSTRIQQQRDKRTNRYLFLGGENYTLAEWAEKLKIPQYLLKGRLKKGWSIERAILTPHRQNIKRNIEPLATQRENLKKPR